MLPRLRSLSAALFRRGRLEQEMAHELEFHLHARAEDLVRRGMPLRDALRQARIEFGGVEHYKEEGRASRGLRLADEWSADVRYACRQLRKSPSFTLLAVAILAIGIGANTAVFSTVDAVMLAQLPVKEPQRLRHLEWTSPQRRLFEKSYDGGSRETAGGETVFWSVSHPVYQYLRDHTTTFSSLSAFSGTAQVSLTSHGSGELARGQLVSGNFFAMLGASAHRGRTLSPDDDRPGAYPAAVLTHGYWERRFGSDPGAIGQTLLVNGTAAGIVGVLPKGWCGIDPGACPDVFLPMTMQPVISASPSVLQKPDYWYFEVMGRLHPGVADERARIETETLMAQAIDTYRSHDSYTPPRVLLQPAANGLGRLRRDLTIPLRVLFCAVAAILLIACANIAGLLLARATARQREIATRLTLGAGRGRIVRQLMVESLLLSGLGAIAGIVVAYRAGDAIVRLFLGDERQLGIAVALNLHVLAASAGLCLLTALLFGLVPALQATRLDTAAALKGSGPAGERSRLMTAKGFIALQVAITLMLVLGSAVFVRTLINLYAQPLGFRSENLLTFRLNPTLNGYQDQRLLNFYEDVVQRVAAVPGVRSASMSRHGILSGGATGDGIHLPGGPNVPVKIHYVAPRFPETVGFPLLSGRDIEWRDRETSERAVVINQALARSLFGNENPLGRTVEMDGKRIVAGIVGDTRYDSLRTAAPATAYIPFRQSRQYVMTVVVRSEVAPQALTPLVRRAVERVDPNVAPYDVRTQRERIGELVRSDRVFAQLLSAFGLMALLLACLGIYGTLAYQVARRTPEIGIRVALGAARADVVAMMMREALTPVTIGVIAGIAGSLAAGKLVAGMLFGLKPNDAATLVGVAAILLVSALAAGWLPAHRAAQVTPMQALRYD